MKRSLALLLGLASAAMVFGQTSLPSITELYVFQAGPDINFPNGAGPGPMIQASDGNFYGTASLFGGCKPPDPCSGTVFKLTPDGEFKTLYTFAYGDPTAPFANGATPLGLVEGPDGLSVRDHIRGR